MPDNVIGSHLKEIYRPLIVVILGGVVCGLAFSFLVPLLSLFYVQAGNLCKGLTTLERFGNKGGPMINASIFQEMVPHEEGCSKNVRTMCCECADVNQDNVVARIDRRISLISSGTQMMLAVPPDK